MSSPECNEGGRREKSAGNEAAPADRRLFALRCVPGERVNPSIHLAMTDGRSRPAISQLASHLTIDLTTIGRRSGKPRRIEIWWFHVNGRFMITGTPGRRDWYANVLANSNVIAHVAGWDLPATAHPVRDPLLRGEVFDTPSTRWYSSPAQRQRLIDEAPMIEIRF